MILKKRLKPNKDNIDIQIGLELLDQEILNAIPDGKTIASLLTNNQLKKISHSLQNSEINF